LKQQGFVALPERCNQINLYRLAGIIPFVSYCLTNLRIPASPVFENRYLSVSAGGEGYPIICFFIVF
jgi:hypothetical protein